MDFPKVELPESVVNKEAKKGPTVICACGHAKGYHRAALKHWVCVSGRGRGTTVFCKCKVPRGIISAPDARWFMYGTQHDGMHPLFLGIAKTQAKGKGWALEALEPFVCSVDGCDEMAQTAVTEEESGVTSLYCHEHQPVAEEDES